MTIEPGSIIEMTEAEIYALNKKAANDYDLLIKAAPDLREALWAMVTSFHAVEYMDDHMKQASRKARAVLAKAEGRPT